MMTSAAQWSLELYGRGVAHNLAAGDRLEAMWVSWIGTLESWERNVVLAHELDRHDLFRSGEWTWADLEHELAETTAAW
jgi:hypothetical protein